MSIMNEIKRRYQWQEDFEKHVKDEVVGKSVTTLYNGRVYRIDNIDFEKCP